MEIVGYFKWRETNLGSFKMGFWWKTHDGTYKCAPLCVVEPEVIDRNDENYRPASPATADVPMLYLDFSTEGSIIGLDNNVDNHPFQLEPIYVVNIMHFADLTLVFRLGTTDIFGIKKKLLADKSFVDIEPADFPANDFMEAFFIRGVPPMEIIGQRMPTFDRYSFLNEGFRNCMFRNLLAENFHTSLKSLKGPSGSIKFSLRIDHRDMASLMKCLRTPGTFILSRKEYTRAVHVMKADFDRIRSVPAAVKIIEIQIVKASILAPLIGSTFHACPILLPGFDEAVSLRH